MPSLGDRIWCMFYKAETNSFFPRCVGKVDGIRGDEVRIAGRWQVLAHPYWTSEEEALKACEGRGPVMPAIK